MAWTKNVKGLLSKEKLLTSYGGKADESLTANKICIEFSNEVDSLCFNMLSIKMIQAQMVVENVVTVLTQLSLLNCKHSYQKRSLKD